MAGIEEIAKAARENSERWFPALHARAAEGSIDLAVFYTLGLAGEVGEVANLVKKFVRANVTPDAATLGDELADVFIYLLLLADEIGVDLVEEYKKKVVVNEERWG